MDNPVAQCPILQLHTNAIYLIGKELPDHAKVLLAQTCRGLRKALYPNRVPDKLSSREHVRLLVQLSRNNAKVYVCAACKESHPVTENDLWGDRRLSSCPHRTISPRPRGVFLVNYVRVQLALKYTRLQKTMASARLSSWLERLMRYEAGIRMTKHGDDGLGIFASTSVPKVVDGRYLIKYKWEYALEKVPSAPATLPLLILCHHQWLARPAEGVVWGDERKQLVRAVEAAMLNDVNGVEYCGSCPFCPTDFSVRIFSDGMYIEAWKDFGPEDGPGNPTWISHSSTEAQRNPHDFGKVRRLYYGISNGGLLS